MKEKTARPKNKRSLSVALLMALLILLPFAGTVQTAPQEVVTLQFLNVSDWHAQLDPLSVFDVGDVGGAAVLSSYWKADREANPNTLTLTGGDAYGASPPLSSYFQEEPAIKAMRLMGFDVDTFGNHNFDRGIDHLQQMIDLAAAPTDADHPGQPFHYVSANLRNVDENLTGVEPFRIFDVGGIKVAVIGITNPDAPTLVAPGSLGTIEVTEPVTAALQARDAAIEQGAQVIVATTHLGVTHTDDQGNASGPLIDFAEGVSGFDLIFGDHTDAEFSETINGALVVENRSKGRTYARVHLDYDTTSGEVVSKTVEFITPLASEVTPDPAIEAMLQPYREQLAAELDTKIGVATDIFPRGEGIERRGEVAIGNLVADAMRLAYGTQLGFTNGGGIRAPFPSSYQPADMSLRRPDEGYAEGPPFDLVTGDVYTVLPFGNAVVTREVTGAQLWQMLEHSVGALPEASGRFGQISGFRFSFDPNLPSGSRVLSVELDDGTPIEPDDTTYTLATNDFLNAGGDGYEMLADGQGTTRELMAAVVVDYIEAQGTISPEIEGRINATYRLMMPLIQRVTLP